MSKHKQGKLVFMIDPDIQIIVIRPIGPLSGPDFVQQLFLNYARVDKPWTYGRLNDFRRFEGHLSDTDLKAIAKGWQRLARGVNYHAHVAVLTNDPLGTYRIPAVSPMFPNETICLFTAFAEAMGWLRSMDRSAFLASLAPFSTPPCDPEIDI